MCNAFEMKLNLHHVGLGSIGGHGSGTAYRHNESGRSEVVPSLRPFIEPGSEIALLKIDTEGHDFNVIAGASNMIRLHRIKTIFMEMHRNVPETEVS